VVTVLGDELEEITVIKDLKKSSEKLIQKFSHYSDLIAIRLGEFKPAVESFDPLKFFKDFKNQSNYDKQYVEQWVVEEKDMPALVSGEKSRFEYLISTLLCNAFQRGGFVSNFILVKVRCWYFTGSLSEEDLEEKKYLQVSVTDQGPKMTKKERLTILKPL